MVKHVVTRTLMFALSSAAILAQAPSFAGTWKLNLAKSQLAGQTVTIEKTRSGTMHFEGSGFGYEFDLTGKEYPMPDGGTTSWREVNPTTWEATNRVKGKTVAIFHLTLNSNTITSLVKLPQADGKTVEQTATFTRLSGETGFLGKWKSTEMKGAPTTMEIAVDASNGIAVNLPEMQMQCRGKFDGKDYPVSTGGTDLDETLAFEKSGPTSFKMTTKLNGKPFYVDVMTLSPDGKVLTDDGHSIAANEPVKLVYERN